MMDELKISKGKIQDLPEELEEAHIYVALKDETTNYSKVCMANDEWVSKDYIDNNMSTVVTKEEFDDTKSKADSAIQPNQLKTINSQSITGTGDITIDLALFVLVNELPTENINPNKIYLVPNKSGQSSNKYDEYAYDDINKSWELLGTYSADVDLSEYLKTADADKKYLSLANGKATLSMGSNGSLNNVGDNGQAFNAVRDCVNTKTGYRINAASFGVKLDGTTAFSHKKYDSFNEQTGAYTGAKNTAVLTFSGPTGIRYAKNTGSASDVTDAMYRYVGVIDSPDENQRVYSKAQVDSLISKMKTILSRLGATDEELNSITI